jgi:HSP20 family protein
MTLVKFNNRTPFPTFVDRFFNGDPFAMAESRLAAERSFIPAVNVRETDTAFEVELAAPGRQREDFKIQLHEQVLSICSEKKSESESKDAQGKYSRKEFSFERFERAFTLPENIMEDEITATYEAGVLKLLIPKKEAEKALQPRLIDIR